ncbi:MAG: low specificity L-threonine aldolase [Paludibacteraceae bacterium]|nr:low specificity L-threonine aldolase [Paludibacteraceae bacterium]MBQ9705126.1 low specificity L-threonine aldolase [Paludibacteraceae bacterium]
MISFTCDYSEGAHPAILQRLTETNMQQEPGYGSDSFTCSAIRRIREATGCPKADVFLLTGGTQTNAVVIDSLLQKYEGVIAVETGHVAVHEAGAIEAAGHKVLSLPQHEGKMDARELARLLEHFYADPTWPHMVIPGMVYISYPTEYGTLYTKEELRALRDVCKTYRLPLYIDGARLAYGLAAADMTLGELASLCDVFYIGGTKAGALCGEAVVFPQGNAPAHFFTLQKQHGALTAKGRLTGLQFDTLFTNGLYFQLGQHGVEAARRLKHLFAKCHIPLFIDSPTNQQFPILTAVQRQALQDKVLFEVWDERPNGTAVCRFATSWATPDEHISLLEQLLISCQTS